MDKDLKMLGNIYGFNGGSYAGAVFGINGCSPTLRTCEGGNQQPCIVEVEKMNAASLRMVRTEEGKRLLKAYENGEIKHGYNDHRKAEPRTDGVTNTITTVQKDNLIMEVKEIGYIEKGTGKQPPTMFVDRQVLCCAMRGRNPDNPKSREAGLPTEQTLEVREDGCCNCLTSVQKDSFVLEKKKIFVNFIEDAQFTKTNDQLTKESSQLTKKEIEVETDIDEKFHKFIYEIDGELYLIRMRKLTPKESWRLMGFTDDDYEKAAAVNSKTQLYKQAGNSIVKPVLMAIMSQLNIQGIRSWNKIFSEFDYD